MANNQYINKVVFGNQTLMDLTSDTVAADKLLRGYTAHDASGASIVGTYEGGGGEGYTINLTASSSELYGQSIVVSYEGQRITTIQFSNAGTASITVQEEGIYNFAVSYGGLTYYCDVNVVSAIVTYNETIYYYPNGSIVTPINDVQIWISCANIRDKNYTTLAEVFADIQLLATLMASENAVNYLVRSKQFIKSEALVPTMTSDTTPEGEAFCTVVRSGYQPYKAFDGNDTSFAVSSTSTQTNGLYIGYEFTEPIKAHYCNFICSNAEVATLKCEASNDNLTWDTISATATTVQDTSVSLQLTPTKAYKYYRLYQISVNPANSFNFRTIQFFNVDEGLTDNATAMSFIGANDYASGTLLADSDWNEAIQNSQYFESVDNVKVPTMTSNNTPSGECIFSSEMTMYEAYHAFTDEGMPTWLSGTTQPTTANPIYVGYQFTDSILVKCFDVVFRSDKVSSVNYKIQNYVNDEWVDISANLNNLSLAKSILNNTNVSDKYRLLITSQATSGNYGQVTTLQFYGRQNGGVQTWLHSAGITNKLYTTLLEVLADTETISALIANKDAVDYLVTCKGWATEVCSNQSAMSYIGLNNYCANTLLADEIWRSAICNSTYFESVLNVKVPTMTSDTTPSGTCGGSSIYGANFQYWRAFNWSEVRGWIPTLAGAVNGYVYYTFTSNVKMYMAEISRNRGATGNTTTVDFIMSSDAVTWTNAKSNYTFNNGASFSDKYKTILDNVSLNNSYGVRLLSTTGSGENLTSGQGYKLQFYGRADI